MQRGRKIARPTQFFRSLLDFSMPRLNGLQAALMLHEVVPDIPIILFTFFKDAILSRLAHNAGVTKDLSKADQLGTLADEIQRLPCCWAN